MDAQSVRHLPLLDRYSVSLRVNGEMSLEEFREHCRLDAAGEAMLRAAVEERGLTARGHVAEALRYRVEEDGRKEG